MKILIAYATTEGQTRKIVRFCSDKLTDQGHSTEVLQLDDDIDVDLSRYDRALLAGSVHLGSYQKELVKFATEHAKELGNLPTLFLAVSLSAAGPDEDDWAGLQKILTEFVKKTGWTPERTEQIAGAFRFTEYDFFRSWAMRWIAAQKGQKVDSDKDTEYTDWEGLEKVLKEWVG